MTDQEPTTAAARPRTPFDPSPTRLAVFDTSVLTSDLIASLSRGKPSSFLAGMRDRTIRGFIPHHVWAEVPRVLVDRHRETGAGFDLPAAEELWWSQYIPQLHVVCTNGLPITPQARVLAGEDHSDVPTTQLADLLAPVVLFAADTDLHRTGLAHTDWGQTRAALGHVGPVEQNTRIALNASLLLTEAAGAAAKRTLSLARANPWTALAAVPVIVLAVRRRAPQRQLLSLLHESLLHEPAVALKTALSDAFTRHCHGEQTWTQAERGHPGASPLHRVARLLALSPEPLTRTDILHHLSPIAPHRHRDLMAGLNRC